MSLDDTCAKKARDKDKIKKLKAKNDKYLSMSPHYEANYPSPMIEYAYIKENEIKMKRNG
jgi:hypothetical protein